MPFAIRTLDRGGAARDPGIHLSDIPALSYDRELFQERTVTSVTATARGVTARSCSVLTARAGLHIVTTPYPFERAGDTLADLAADRVNGAAVITVA